MVGVMLIGVVLMGRGFLRCVQTFCGGNLCPGEQNHRTEEKPPDARVT